MSLNHKQPDPSPSGVGEESVGIATEEPKERGSPPMPNLKLWSATDPFQRHLPNPDPGFTNGWNVLQDKQKKVDNDHCDALKDEIGDVLIFAALFSAIVAAFTLESSKRLRSTTRGQQPCFS
ncbi:hypothetical protein NMY22_g3142 [Coprinellus aureogranulatus]|nr:hypothetical protein NMY22_g3142 [Coprinellus aureogranulatus]